MVLFGVAELFLLVLLRLVALLSYGDVLLFRGFFFDV